MDIVDQCNLGKKWDELAKTNGEKVALIFESIDGNSCKFTYKELNCEINKSANLFISLGVKKGDRVALHLFNSPELIMIWFGLAKIGAVTVPINAYYLHYECSYIIKKCKPKFVVTEERFIQLYKTLHEENSLFLEDILIARANDDNKSYKNFNTLKDKHSCTLLKKVNVKPHDMAEILFTSGTTSLPKGVVITHYNILFAGRYTSWQCGIKPDDIYLTVMPAWHVDFQCTAAMPTFTMGATLVVIQKYSSRKFWSQICFYKATITEAIPKIICTLMLQPCQVWEKNHSLREILFYLKLSKKQKDDFTKRYNVKLFTSYGMTETIAGLIGDRVGDERRWPSIGRVGFCYEAKIVDKNLHEVKPNTIGELYVKGEIGKTIFKEYYQDKDATKKALHDGWLKTGDMAYMDRDGYFYFVDRGSNMIKIAGENVSALEVEEFIDSHQKVYESAVVGIDDEICGKIVIAFVVPMENETVKSEEILEYCRKNISKFKVPSDVKIVNSLPKTCSGKVKKNILKLQYKG